MKLWVTDLDNTLCDTDVLEGSIERMGELKLFPDVAKLFKVLVAQGVPIVVLTKGDFVMQRSKLHQLGLTEVVDEIYVASSDAEKTDLFRKILETYDVLLEDVVMIGDRRGVEICIGAGLGVKTIWYKYGKYNKSGDAPEGVFVAESYQDVLELVADL